MQLHRLELGHVVLPDAHPRAADQTCTIFSFAVEHPDGVIVVDTGPRMGHPVIDELYAPEVISIVEALHAASLDERDVVAIVNTHLHFDHCGQNVFLPNIPIWVTAAEIEAALAEDYTVPDWAEIEEGRRRLSRDGEEIAPGVRLIHTPGHTPGHQSIVVDTPLGVELIVGQACYSCGEFASERPAATDMHDASWIDQGLDSMKRLRSMEPTVAHFSHDKAVYQSG